MAPTNSYGQEMVSVFFAIKELFDKNWVSAIVFEIISIYSFLAMGLKLHQVKALPKVGE